MGLFALGIWLHPKELQCLLDILDKVTFSPWECFPFPLHSLSFARSHLKCFLFLLHNRSLHPYSILHIDPKVLDLVAFGFCPN